MSVRSLCLASDVRRVPGRVRCVAVAVAGLAVLAGCRQDMYDQPRYEPQEPSSFFADGTSDRPVVPGTVARLAPRAEPRQTRYNPTRLELEGRVDLQGPEADAYPFPIDRAAVERGRQRYMIFCSPCHGATGDGQGMIVRRGFPAPPPLYGPRPPSPTTTAGSPAVVLYDDLRTAPVGHFYNVITHGHGAMYSYASRIPPDDRWKIAAFIRALQLSRYATIDDLKAIADPTGPERRLLEEVGR